MKVKKEMDAINHTLSETSEGFMWLLTTTNDQSYIAFSDALDTIDKNIKECKKLKELRVIRDSIIDAKFDYDSFIFDSRINIGSFRMVKNITECYAKLLEQVSELIIKLEGCMNV